MRILTCWKIIFNIVSCKYHHHRYFYFLWLLDTQITILMYSIIYNLFFTVLPPGASTFSASLSTSFSGSSKAHGLNAFPKRAGRLMIFSFLLVFFVSFFYFHSFFPSFFLSSSPIPFFIFSLTLFLSLSLPSSSATHLYSSLLIPHFWSRVPPCSWLACIRIRECSDACHRTWPCRHRSSDVTQKNSTFPSKKFMF